MAQYRKALVAALGFVAIVLPDVFGVVQTDSTEDLIDAVLGVLTAFGVFKVENAPAPLTDRVAR